MRPGRVTLYDKLLELPGVHHISITVSEGCVRALLHMAWWSWLTLGVVPMLCHRRALSLFEVLGPEKSKYFVKCVR